MSRSVVPISIGGASASRRAQKWAGDVAGLEAQLRRTVGGEVRFDAGSRGAYSTDASNYRQVPIGVVVPRDEEDVNAAVAAAREFGAPVLPRGGGTSLAGQTCNVAVVMDFSKYMRHVIEFDPDARRARVQPGIVLDDLERTTQEHGLFFPPDPATHDRCTIGGMIGNNSCGVHSVMAGKTVDNVESVRVLLYDGTELEVGPTPEDEIGRLTASNGRKGEIYKNLRDLRDEYQDRIREGFPRIPRRVSGYNLDQLLPENRFDVARALVGTEGTCATVLSADLTLSPLPAARVVVALGFPSVFAAADAVPEVLRHGPIGLEGLDDYLIRNLERKGQHRSGRELLPDGSGWLLVEMAGQTVEEAESYAREMAASMNREATALIFRDGDEQEELWKVRESGLGATAKAPGEPDAWPGWEDSAVAPGRLGGYLRDLKALFGQYRYQGALYGHFGDGCVHVRIDFDLVSGQGTTHFRSFLEEAADLVVSYGGSLSGEHGDGQARGPLLERMYGPELMEAFRRFKAIWDPDGRMNPGKVVDASAVDADLRLGSDWRPREPATEFALPADGGSFSRAALRCVGVGECRKTESGTMCPSYMATREEEHSTRGRARLLFEMLEGDPVEGGWRSDEVRRALDLCLSCKACKSECPVNVDMATYKAEFMHHHYKRRLRPGPAYAMGLIPIWARLASRMPRLANRIVTTRLAGKLKGAGGIAPQRPIPPFAHETFRQRFRDRSRASSDRTVVLWPDTFTNFFSPHIGVAATDVLERAGWRVEVPASSVCCGRPLYEFGFIPTARRMLTQSIRVLGPQLRSGTPIVVLEPSCAAAFRDELVELMPNDPEARRLASQVHTLAEFLADIDYEPPLRQEKLMVQRHCHHGSVLGFDPDEEMLRRTGAEVEVLDSGCCGMAGSFGYELDKYEVSMAVGERVLLPKVREAAEDTIVVADGFSCRTQIADGAGRQARHLAEILAYPQEGT